MPVWTQTLIIGCRALFVVHKVAFQAFRGSRSRRLAGERLVGHFRCLLIPARIHGFGFLLLPEAVPSKPTNRRRLKSDGLPRDFRSLPLPVSLAASHGHSGSLPQALLEHTGRRLAKRPTNLAHATSKPQMRMSGNSGYTPIPARRISGAAPWR